ncbi:MAG TPA: hypothetical protein VMV70_06325 [Gallionella sp.]|nr:hypothetical protein [Gallionella sp.]HUW76280.1 hypothetical protein [Gallionella sp.]
MKFRSYVVGALMCSVFVAYFAYADGYRVARIVSPKPDATVHNNSGNLVVTVATSPPLHAGDRITLLLDGRTVSSGYGQRFQLQGINRGSHTLRVHVNAPDGKVLAVSAPVTFHMWQASRLFRNRAN